MSEWVTLCQPSCSAEAVETVISNSETINNIINEQNNITNTVTNQTTEMKSKKSLIVFLLKMKTKMSLSIIFLLKLQL